MARQSIRPASLHHQPVFQQAPTLTGISLLLLLAVCGSDARADDRVDELLQQWVDGAANVERPSQATAQARFGRDLSEHQLQAALTLWVPESIESLTSQFDWTAASTANGFVLTGSPRSDVDRAFIGRVDVLWNQESQRPTRIQFALRPVAVTFATIRRRRMGVIHQAAFYPPSEGELPVDDTNDRHEVRTASATVVADSAGTVQSEVATLLERWAAASVTSDAWELRLQASDIDNVFASEQQYYVTMRGDGAGTIEVCWDPVLLEPGSVDTERLAPDGTPFTLQEGPARNWVFTSDEALFADTRSQLVRRLPLSSFNHFPWYKHPLHTPSCMTFNLPVDANELASRYLWEIVSRDAQQVHLHGTPADDEVSQSISAVDVVLNAGTCLPEEIHCFEAGGSHEHVMQLLERAIPVGLTQDVILSGYSSFSPVPEKGSEPR
jgi:hypothetical protein